MSCELPHAPHSTLPATWPDPIWRLPNTHVSPPCFYIEGSQLNADYRVKNVPRNYFDIRFSTRERRLIATLLFFYEYFLTEKLTKALTLVIICIWETTLATLARFARFSSPCRETPEQHVKLCVNGPPTTSSPVRYSVITLKFEAAFWTLPIELLNEQLKN